MIRQGRNSKCYCGSNKKAKNCCLIAGHQSDYARVAFRKSDLAHHEASVFAGVGGAITFQTPQEPAMAPPRWLAWLMLLGLAASVAGAVVALSSRI